MKIEIRSKILKAALSKITHATAAKAALPVCQCIHIQAEAGSIRMSATDLDLYLTLEVEGEVKEDGGAIIHPSKFKHLLESTDEIVRIETTVKASSPSTKITLGKFRRESPSLALDLAVGKMKMEDTKDSFTIIGETLVDGLNSVDRSISQSGVNSDYAITGVRFKMGESDISLCSTNKQRVSMRKIAVNTHQVPDFTLPGKSVDTIKRVLPIDADVEISATGKAVRLKWDGGELLTKTIEAAFPNVGTWLMMAMKDDLQWCRVKRDAILKPLERVASVNDFTNIKVECKEGLLHMENDTLGKINPELAEDIVKLEAGGDIEAFYIKGGYLQDAILSCHEDEFEFTRTDKAFALRSKDLRFIGIIAYARNA